MTNCNAVFRRAADWNLPVRWLSKAVADDASPALIGQRTKNDGKNISAARLKAVIWSFCLGASTLFFAGCGGTTIQQPVFRVEVTIDQKPVESVRVAFAVKGDPSRAIVLEGITDHTGTAAMLLKEEGHSLAIEPTEYMVVCESLGDWQIAKPWSDPKESPLTVTWPSSEVPKIDLPVKAVRTL